MNEYKLYLLDKRGGITRAIDVKRPTDEMAIAVAEIVVRPHGSELWKGAAKIAVFNADPIETAAPRALSARKSPRLLGSLMSKFTSRRSKPDLELR